MDNNDQAKADGDRRKSAAPALQDTNSQQEEELVAASASQRNWRGIGIALLVICVVCALIITAVVLLTPGNEGPRVKGERFTLDDILGDNFTVDRFNGSWISDFEFLYRSKTGALMLYNANNKNATVFMTNSTFRQVNAQDWSVSFTRDYVLLTHDMMKAYRHTYLAKYSIYDIKTDQFIRLTPTEGKHLPLQYATWSPNGSSLFFVYENDIYFKSSPEADVIQRLTFTGLEGTVWNGIPDWVYEEEILHTNRALWISDDGKLLCYASFNDTQVDVMHYVWYGNSDERYSRIASVRYPKPGLRNPVVDLFVLDLNDPTNHIRLVPPDNLDQQDHYFTAVRWIDSTQVSVIWMNRAQNVSIITVCKAPLWYCTENHRVESDGLGWVELYDPPLFSVDRSRYFIIIPAKDGASGYYPQVALKNIAENKVHMLTHGKWEVTSILAYDEVGNSVYYIAAPEGKPGQRHLYKVTADTSNVYKQGDCISCHLGPECLYVSASFSVNATFHVLECLGPDVPRAFLYNTRDNESLVELNSHDELRGLMETRAMPQIRTFRVPLDQGFEAHVRLFLPPGLRDEEITQYPLVVEVYGGPASQLVKESFRVGWDLYMASHKNIIYAYIDGRGSGFQGNRVQQELYRRLGTVEVEDQIVVTKYLIDNLHFVDPTKIAIWGWSYGGYVTAMVLGTEAGLFNCGISVAPVTSWLYYDSVYTERYMGTPDIQDNNIGYERSEVLKRAENFKDKHFFLIHGTADDNVHLQQSMMLSKALTKAGVIFRTQFYPDENHSLGGVKRHLYQSMEAFLDECFRKEKVEEIGLQNPGS